MKKLSIYKDKHGKQIGDGDTVLAQIGDYESHFYCTVSFSPQEGFRLHGAFPEGWVYLYAVGAKNMEITKPLPVKKERKQRSWLKFRVIERGRYALHFNDQYTNYLSFDFGKSRWLGFGFNRGGRSINFNVYLPFIGCMYVKWHNERLFKYSGEHPKHHFYLICESNPVFWIYINHLEWFDLKKRPNHWQWQCYWYPLDFIFGRHKCVRTPIEEGERELVMPEGLYTVAYKVEDFAFKRPRWPFTRHSLHIDMTPDRGIPTPGKGENSWDIDDDATFGMSMPFDGDIDKAIESLRNSTFKERERHGGSRNWQPNPKKGEHEKSNS